MFREGEVCCTADSLFWCEPVVLRNDSRVQTALVITMRGLLVPPNPTSTKRSSVVLSMFAVAAVCLGVQGCGGGKIYNSLEEAQNETCVDLADPGQACLDYCLECIAGYYHSHEYFNKDFNEELVQGCGSSKICPPAGYRP